jgi:hypothetical protein
MQRGKLTRLIPIALVIIVVIVAIAALISFGRSIFGGNSSNTPTTNDTSNNQLLDTSAGRGVRMTVRGPIVADESFRSYQISVTSDQRSLTTYQGYLEKPLDNAILGNNTAAYDQFVHALDKAGLMKGDALVGDKDDTRGICATGRVYEFQLFDGAQAGKRLWTSTCGGSKGSLEANLNQVTALFVNQVPNASDAISKLNFATANVY